MTDKILLIDSNALVHRAFHAFPKNLTNREGQVVNAVYGFTRILLSILKDFKPEYVVCAFDTHAPTFRHKMYDKYKATRPKMDEDLVKQFPLVHEMLKVLNIPTISQSGLEADDIIGTLSRSKALKGIEKIVVTGDRDLFQLIDQQTKIYMAGNNFTKSVLYDQENIVDRLGFAAANLIDFKGIRGDTSDNIPGVKGIGDKIATDLIKQYATIENIYQNLEQIKPAISQKLQAQKTEALLSKELATIKTDAELKFDLLDCKLSEYDQPQAVKYFEKLQFRSLIRMLPNYSVQDLNRNQQLDLLTSNFAPVEVNSALINDQKQIAQLFTRVNQQKQLVIDVEYDEFDIFAPAETIALLDQDQVKCLAIASLDESNSKLLGKILANKQVKKVFLNAKQLMHSLISAGFKEIQNYTDLGLAAFLLDGGKGKQDLESIIFRYLNIYYEQNNSNDFVKSSSQKLPLMDKLLSKLETDLLKSRQLKNGWNLVKLLNEVELPMIGVLIKMERQGITLDTKYLSKLANELDVEIDKIKHKIFEQSGEEFNIASPKQLGEVLFAKLALPGAKKSRTGQFQTNEKILSKLAAEYEIVRDIREYRELSKLRSTYTTALIDQVNKRTGRLHTNYRLNVAATGRLASIRPNLQNIPISSEWGQKIRKSFVAEHDKLLLFIDYSQQELRLLAHFSNEPKLIAAFKNQEDIHALTAGILFNKAAKDVNKTERRIGKTVNFGIVYGISPFGLSEGLNVTPGEAQTFIAAFNQNYPQVKVFFDNLLANARKDGYTQTILGRIRNTVDLNATNFQIRSATEREVINFPLQGSAADMMKLAMIKVDKLITDKYADFAKMILQIHDELVFEVDTTDKQDKMLLSFANDVSNLMLDVFELSLPMKVDVEIGKDMTELTNLQID